MNTKELIQLLRTSNEFSEVNNHRGEIAAMIPQVVSMFDYDQNNSYHPYDLWEHCVRTALKIPKDITDDMLFLAAMLHDIGKPESRCAGRKAGDTESHYYGHPEASKRIVEEDIIPVLNLAPEDAKRLIYYVQFHDDHVGFKAHHLRKHYDRVPLPVFKNLMLLQMADAMTHTWEKPLIQERYTTCKVLYDGKAEELYSWLANEKRRRS